MIFQVPKYNYLFIHNKLYPVDNFRLKHSVFRIDLFLMKMNEASHKSTESGELTTFIEHRD